MILVHKHIPSIQRPALNQYFSSETIIAGKRTPQNDLCLTSQKFMRSADLPCSRGKHRRKINESQ